MSRGDHRHAGSHRLRHREAEALAPGGVHIATGDCIERVDRCFIHIPIDPTHIGGIEVMGAQLGEMVANKVVWVGKCLENEGDVFGTRELSEVGGQKGVDPFPREARADVQEAKRPQVFQLGSIASSLSLIHIFFEEMEGFDAAFAVAFNDIDFCLRLGLAGYRVLYRCV